MIFATDTDLLVWEPDLFQTAALVSQTLLAGSGDLAGTQFTVAGGGMTPASAGLTRGHVITFTSGLEGSYALLDADDSVLTVSAVHEGIFPASGDPVAIAPRRR